MDPQKIVKYSFIYNKEFLKYFLDLDIISHSLWENMMIQLSRSKFDTDEIIELGIKYRFPGRYYGRKNIFHPNRKKYINKIKLPFDIVSDLT